MDGYFGHAIGIEVIRLSREFFTLEIELLSGEELGLGVGCVFIWRRSLKHIGARRDIDNLPGVGDKVADGRTLFDSHIYRNLGIKAPQKKGLMADVVGI